MNILLYLCYQFFNKEYINIIALVCISLFLTLFYTNIASIVNAKLIESIHKSSYKNSVLFFQFFIGVSLIYFFIMYIYKYISNHLLTNLVHWSKSEIFNCILLANNSNMRNINFVEFITPITRISNSLYLLLHDVISDIIPSFAFLLMVSGYMFTLDLKMGLIFLFANIAIFGYFYFNYKEMMKMKNEQEEISVDNEKYIIDALNNIDKIIYRGQVKKEIDEYKKKTDGCINISLKMFNYMTNHTFTVNMFAYGIVIYLIWQNIQLYYKKQISNTSFITILSILMMYRDDITNTIQRVPSQIETFGRTYYIVEEFRKMLGTDQIDAIIDNSKYKDVSLDFEVIKFENVSFKYESRDKYIFKDYNKEVYLKDKIIGIIGSSGNGKSSFVKLVMRLYSCSEGVISIDGKDILTIEPEYIRNNVTYVNQSSRLFDRKIMENILYGCQDLEKCNGHLRDILSHPQIRDLYKNVDIEQATAGPLGENLSGGQRQIINIISGLVNPTPVLILDEPTNALDPSLKNELLSILRNFQKYKKCIFIITHDRDVYSLFDETIEI